MSQAPALAPKFEFNKKVAEAFIQNFQRTHSEYTVETLDLWSADLPEFGRVEASGKYKGYRGMAQSEGKPTPTAV